MNRYNVFNQVHKGLRALLYETALAVQQTDFDNREEAKATSTRLAEVIELFETHADTEDRLVFPAIREYEPSVVLAFEDEHDKDHALGQRLKELLFVLEHSVSEETKLQTGQNIQQAFVDFMVFNLEHMAKEETVINKFLWRYYTDEQLHELTQTIVSQVSPEMMGKYSRWIVRGLNNREIATWLREVKGTAPEFVFAGLMTITERELHSHRWSRVREQVKAEAAVA
jgi:hypothetical protein